MAIYDGNFSFTTFCGNFYHNVNFNWKWHLFCLETSYAISQLKELCVNNCCISKYICTTKNEARPQAAQASYIFIMGIRRQSIIIISQKS